MSGLGVENERADLTRDRKSEPASRGQIFRHEWGQGKRFLADHGDSLFNSRHRHGLLIDY